MRTISGAKRALGTRRVPSHEQPEDDGAHRHLSALMVGDMTPRAIIFRRSCMCFKCAPFEATPASAAEKTRFPGGSSAGTLVDPGPSLLSVHRLVGGGEE